MLRHHIQVLESMSPFEGDDYSGLVIDTDAYVRRHIEVYDLRARQQRLFYRVSGITIILVSTALPALTNLNYAGKNLVISLAGFVIAIAASLRAFYRWDQRWILLRKTEIQITTEYARWRDKVLKMNLGEDELKAATEEMRESVSQARKEESQVFFKDLTFPSRESH